MGIFKGGNKGGNGNGNGSGSGNGDKPEQPKPRPQKMLHCSKCSFSCLSPADLQAHASTAHGEKA